MRGRLVAQAAGFVVSLGLLAWFVRLALSEENREQLSVLASASWGEVGLLAGLSIATIYLNGLIFWVTLLPARRIGHWDTAAVNAIGYLASYLPFKLSVAARVVIHNRRDGVPLATIGAWFAAVGIVAVATLTPLGAVGWWRGRADWVWASASAGCVLATTIGVIASAGWLAGDRGMARIEAASRRFGWLGRVTRTGFFRDAHAGLDMLAHRWAVGATVGLRLLDLAVQAWRFVLVAALLGHEITIGSAVLFATIFFLVGALSPLGLLGTRDGLVVLAAGAAGVAQPSAFVTVALTVTASELMTALGGAATGVAWLGPHRLLTPVSRMIGSDAPGPGPDQSDGG